ncbi:MAG: J domain-containing protein [Deltaproteobacteria bacterium]|nr:J domain-containing protein [Deltaproteobacteria bacterium]
MINLSVPGQGELGEGTWFSELFLSAVQSRLTGGILVEGLMGAAAVFFREGLPVHAAGAAFTTHFLGSILVEMGACQQAHVDDAVAKQGAAAEAPVLGAILVADAGVSPADVKRAIQRQNVARLQTLFSWGEGRWQAAPGENARIRDLGVPTPAWGIFFEGLTQAADGELRELADGLLGRAVQLRGGTLGVPDHEPGAAEKKLIQYLEKPRKPDHLERAMNNRRQVRGFLRAAQMLERLTVHPAAKAIAIPKASLVKTTDLPGAEALMAAVESARQAEAAPPPSRNASAPPRAPAAPKVHPIVKEVEALHAAIKTQNHFELLGADDKTSPADLRKLFTALAKKYHPDAFPSEVAAEVATKAREITARLNEAYQTLTNDEKKKEYMRLLADKRIRGDVKKVEKVRDAETKAQMGTVMLRKKEFRQAREFFKSAMELDPETAEYKAHYAWAIYVNPATDRDKAVQEALPILKEALAQEGKSAAIHFYVGQIQKSLGNEKDALFHFRAAVSLDPKHGEALREVRLLDLRDQKKKDDPKGSGKNGLVSRLFKR